MATQRAGKLAEGEGGYFKERPTTKTPRLLIEEAIRMTPGANKTDAPNPAIASLFHIEDHWRRVGDPRR
jgi:hypothetical protein